MFGIYARNVIAGQGRYNPIVENTPSKTKCPKCNGETRLINGKHGLFRGCKAYPTCKGSTKA